MSYQPMAPPAVPPAPATTRPAKIKPSAAWYWIGGLLIAAGIIGAAAIFFAWVVNTSNLVDNFARIRVPPEGQQVTLDFKKAGTYTIYYEWRSAAEGQKVRNDSSDPPSDLRIEMTAPDGSPVQIRSDDRDFSFSFNDKLGQAVARVDIPAPGTYTMSVSSNATEPFVIAVGKGVLQTIWPWWLLGMIAAFVVGVGLGLYTIIRTAVVRGRRKRELRRAQQLGGYGTPVPAYAGAYGPGPGEWTPPPSTEGGWGAPIPPAAPPHTPEPPTAEHPMPPPAPADSPPPRPSEPFPAPPGEPPERGDDPWAPPKG